MIESTCQALWHLNSNSSQINRWQYGNLKKNSIKKTSNKSGKAKKMEMQQLLTIEKEEKSSLPLIVWPNNFLDLMKLVVSLSLT